MKCTLPIPQVQIIRFPLSFNLKLPMAGNKPLSREEFKAYRKERERLNKSFETAKRTVKVMYKSLCPACEYNAAHGKKIIYNCPHCKVRYWNNCSPLQVKNGHILKALQNHYGNIEWLKAFNPDGSLCYEWRRHEQRYKQDLDGRWVPKE